VLRDGKRFRKRGINVATPRNNNKIVPNFNRNLEKKGNLRCNSKRS
jgi:hypothetical protein